MASLPQSADAERAILGAILLDNSAISQAVKYVSSGDFFHKWNQCIFRRILEMRQAGQTVDLVTLSEELAGSAQLEDVGGPNYISSLVDPLAIPRSNTAVEEWAKIVREKAVLRRMAVLGDRLARAVENGDDLEKLHQNLRDLATERLEPQKVVGGNGHLSYGLMEFLNEQFPSPEHLVEGLIPRAGTVMLVAMPHHLKSWFTTSLALATSVAGMALGKLEVKKPVRTLLIQVEDFPGQVQWRIRQLLNTEAFRGRCDPDNVRIIPRCDLHLPDESWYQTLLAEVEKFKAEHVILDVVRRIFRGDINSQQDTSPFLEQLDRLREVTGATPTLVHHENRKEADLMYASAGSYTLPSWANVMVQFKRKIQEGSISHVEIEVDNKLAQSPDPMRMILDLTSETPVRLEALEELAAVEELRNELGVDWTIRELAEVMHLARTSAQRRLKKFLAAGVVEKLTGGKRGRSGGLARYSFVGDQQP